MNTGTPAVKPPEVDAAAQAAEQGRRAVEAERAARGESEEARAARLANIYNRPISHPVIDQGTFVTTAAKTTTAERTDTYVQRLEEDLGIHRQKPQALDPGEVERRVAAGMSREEAERQVRYNQTYRNPGEEYLDLVESPLKSIANVVQFGGGAVGSLDPLGTAKNTWGEGWGGVGRAIGDVVNVASLGHWIKGIPTGPTETLGGGSYPRSSPSGALQNENGIPMENKPWKVGPQAQAVLDEIGGPKEQPLYDMPETELPLDAIGGPEETVFDANDYKPAPEEPLYDMPETTKPLEVESTQGPAQPYDKWGTGATEGIGPPAGQESFPTEIDGKETMTPAAENEHYRGTPEAPAPKMTSPQAALDDYIGRNGLQSDAMPRAPREPTVPEIKDLMGPAPSQLRDPDAMAQGIAESVGGLAGRGMDLAGTGVNAIVEGRNRLVEQGGNAVAVGAEVGEVIVRPLWGVGNALYQTGRFLYDNRTAIATGLGGWLGYKIYTGVNDTFASNEEPPYKRQHL